MPSSSGGFPLRTLAISLAHFMLSTVVLSRLTNIIPNHFLNIFSHDVRKLPSPLWFSIFLSIISCISSYFQFLSVTKISHLCFLDCIYDIFLFFHFFKTSSYIFCPQNLSHLPKTPNLITFNSFVVSVSLHVSTPYNNLPSISLKLDLVISMCRLISFYPSQCSFKENPRHVIIRSLYNTLPSTWIIPSTFVFFWQSWFSFFRTYELDPHLLHRRLTIIVLSKHNHQPIKW